METALEVAAAFLTIKENPKSKIKLKDILNMLRIRWKTTSAIK